MLRCFFTLVMIWMLVWAWPVVGQSDDSLDEIEEFIDDDEFIDDEDEFIDDEEDEFIDDEDEFVDEDEEFINGEDEFIEDEDVFLDFIDFEEEEDDFFDAITGSFDDWLDSDDLIDWDADGEFDEEDFELLQWLFDENTGDVDGDGFFDEDDFFLSRWQEGEDAVDANGDGLIDGDDFILFQEFSGVFENEIFFVFIEAGFNRAAVEWETAEPGSVDTVFYRPLGESVWQTATRAADANDLEFDDLFDHLVVLTGLQADTEYEIQVRSLSVDGFSSEAYEDGFQTRRGADLRPAVILDLDYDVDLEEAYLFWETNRLTDARYTLLRVADGLVVASDTLDRAGDFTHYLELTGLALSTEYEITIESVPVGLGGVADEVDIKDSETLRFATRSGQVPVRLLFPPFEVVGPTSALVSVEFNQSVRLRLDYARIDNFRSSATSTATAKLYKDTLATGKSLRNHLINVPKLKANTAYRYRITAFAASGDSFTTDPRGSNQWNFDWQFTTSTASDTLAPIIIEGPEIVARDRIAVLEWVTDVETTGRVFFGTQGSTYGTSDEFSANDLATDGTPNFSNEHRVTLAGLDPATKYQFRIESTATNGRKVVFTPRAAAGKIVGTLQPPGGAGSFTTDSMPDTQLPVILSGPSITSRTHNSAIVEWTTDEPANSQVRFGSSGLDENARSGDSGLEHKLVLSNLQAATSYRYKVSSTDATGNGPVQSAEGAFTTHAEADLTSPKLTAAPSIIYKNDRSATLRWTTDEVATGRVVFGLNDSLSTRRKLTQTGTQHEVTLTNLSPATRYYYRVAATDLSNNGPTQSALDSFVTDTGADLTSPTLAAIEAVAADSLAIVRWTTDEVADSFVEFGVDSLVLGTRVGDGKDVLAHEIALTNLVPGTRYFLKVGSVDRADNPPVESAVFSLLTLSAADTLAPPPPKALRALPGSEQVVLSWNSSASLDLAGYNIYRSSTGSAFQVLVTLVPDTTYVDQGLSNGTDYRYRVTAVDRAAVSNESAAVDTVSVQPTASAAPSAPTPLVAQGKLLTPTLVFANATPFKSGAALTYVVQVSADSNFATFIASVSGLSEGTEASEAGKTAWVIDRQLNENSTFYWRVRAEENDLLGPFSVARQFITQRQVAALVGDFNGDKSVNFDDFFLFVDAFGKSATVAGAIYDLDQGGRVDFDDFFLFVDNFGKSTSSKRWLGHERAYADARFVLEASGGSRAENGLASVRLLTAQVEQLRSFGLVLRYDAEQVSFVGLREGHLLESGGRAPLLHVLAERPGEIAVGNGLVDGGEVSGAGLLAELRFRVVGAPGEVVFSPRAFVARADGYSQEVAPFAPARLIPHAYRLGTNYPNPFNPSTSIDFALPEDGMVRLSIYDVLGRRIKVLLDEGAQRAGYHTVAWDGRDALGRGVASGVYFYVLEAGAFRQARKMILIK